jgi:hypothetical protein
MQSLALLIAFCLTIPAVLNAQDRFGRNFYKEMEVYGGLGAAAYFGDIGGKDSKITGPRALFDNLDIDLWQVRPLMTAGLRVNPFKYLAFSVQISPTRLSGNDLRSNYASRKYEFKTSVWETALLAEFYLADRVTGYAPYGTIGLSGLLFRYTDGASDQRSPVHAASGLIMGFGTRLPSSGRITHSLDACFHFTSTDRLDGYQTPKDSKDLFFTLTYKFNFLLYSAWFYDHKGLVR